jgi:adenylate cyclase
MAQEGFKRKLTAILSADVIGYSRLMRNDEEATVRDLAAHRALLTEIIQKHYGRVVDSPGDNILAEFASVVDAVNGAIKIQEEIKKSNSGIPKDRRMEFRIGINLGDVIEEEERIYGDGVNIAARVEGLAAAGGISISGTVYEHIKDKLSLGYHYLGEQNVKNIPEPVGVYRLLTGPEDAGKMIGEEGPKPKKWIWAAISGMVLLVLVVGALVIWNFYLRSPIETALVEKMAHPLPDKPSIAVLPFTNMSDDPEQEYFSDGLTEEVITALSKTQKMFVIARHSTFVYKGKSVEVRQVAEELGVRYVLEGSVRRAVDRVRITSQLIDALTGHHLWAETYDRNLKDIFALQDEITLKIITELQVNLTDGEQARVMAKRTSNLMAYLKFLQAQEYLRRFNKEDNIRARKTAEETIALDPNYSGGYSILAYVELNDVWLGLSKSPIESLMRAIELAKKAIAIEDPYDSHIVLARTYILLRKHDEAVSEAKKALEMIPNSADAHVTLGHVLMLADMAQEAVPVLEKAIRLNPYPPGSYFHNLAFAYSNLGKYDEAIAAANNAVRVNPNDVIARSALVCTYSFLGQEEEARAEAAEILRIDPHFSSERVKKTSPLKNKEKLERIIEALAKAGL